jgi:hypothetical protein
MDSHSDENKNVIFWLPAVGSGGETFQIIARRRIRRCGAYRVRIRLGTQIVQSNG